MQLGGLGAAVRPSSGAERLLPRSACSRERLSPAPGPTASARQVTCVHAGSPGHPWHQPQRGGSAQPSSQGPSPSASPRLLSSSHRAWAAAPATPIPPKQPVSTSPFSLPFPTPLLPAFLPKPAFPRSLSLSLRPPGLPAAGLHLPRRSAHSRASGSGCASANIYYCTVNGKKMLSKGCHTPTALFPAITPHFWLPFSSRAAAASAPSCQAAASRGSGFCAGAVLGHAEPHQCCGLDLLLACCLWSHSQGLWHRGTETPCCPPCLQLGLHPPLPGA